MMKGRQGDRFLVTAYVNGVSEAIFKVGMCLPAGPYVSDDDVKYIGCEIHRGNDQERNRIMKRLLKGVWAFCSYLFVPQRRPRDYYE